MILKNCIYLFCISVLLSCSSTTEDELIYSKIYSEKYIYNVYSKSDSSYYNSLIPKLNDSEILNENQLNFPKRWVEVIVYDSTYYLNYSSDGCNRQKRIVSRNYLNYLTCDASIGVPISSIEEISQNRFLLNIMDVPLRVSFLDTLRGIAVWDFDGEYTLLANVELFETIPVAVADCNGNKCPDNFSDTINYVELLRHHFPKD